MRPPLLALLFLVACGPPQECLEVCESFGLERTAPGCIDLCTASCESVAERYGVNEERCEEIQAGER